MRSAPSKKTKRKEAPRSDRRAKTTHRLRSTKPAATSYVRIRSIDGRHPLQGTAPSAVVPYSARRRRDSRISFFNFELARQIGLLPPSHPDQLDRALERAVLDAFSLVIVNEWDVSHGRQPAAADRKPHPYMATRYLQLQHPDHRGLNSGDGRSIWNGIVHGRDGAWDVSSCGTGVTRLCPATSALGRFFKTGNAITDYGCGTAHVDEGIGAALMSEAFARNGIRTERVLAVLSLPSGLAINVRVAPNLLRPSHFFGLLRRREDEDLRRCVLYYAEREIQDGRWPGLGSEVDRIRYFAERVAMDFARTTARFESEYIFCWLDWDGDNILTDGSIIDYGSVRQFGLFHHDYRFEDSDRMSTSLTEQRQKARQIVQRFAQIRDLLLDGTPPPLERLREDALLERFDIEFDRERRRLFLVQIGFDEESTQLTLDASPTCLERLLTLHRRFEKRRSSRGRRRVADGLSWDAVYCMRDVLRELPQRLLEHSERADERIPAEAFSGLALSAYATRRDANLTPYRRRLIAAYQRAYLDLAGWVAGQRERSLHSILTQLAPQAEARNPFARMTGDGLTHATRRLAGSRSRLTPEEMYRLIQAFADSQQREGRVSARDEGSVMGEERPLVRRIHRDLQVLTRDYRESL